MKKYLNAYYLGLMALIFLAIAFFFELVVPVPLIRNVTGTISGVMIVGIVFYVVVIKMILKK